MPQNKKSPLSKIRPRRAIWPILIGLGVVAWMVARDFDPAIFANIRFSWQTLFWLVLAFLCMAGRDVGYMIRVRVLSGRALSWRSAFRVIMLWEFTSAITPSAVGGTSVAVIYIHKEGIGIGRSSAIVMLTSLLDELYFVVMFPLLLLLAGVGNLFEVAQADVLASSLKWFALIAYGIKVAWVILLSYGLFVNPRGIKWLIVNIFRWRVLRRWRHGALTAGSEIVVASREIKNRDWKFWAGACGATFLSWSSRYLVANALIMAFFSVSDQFMLFARQLVMWVVMLVMPTPGGSGFAEYIFSNYCADLISVPVGLQAGAAMLIALLWRGITYYPYLAIGAVMFPRWLARNFGDNSSQKSSK